jgi:alkaline phosphatase D
MAEEASPSTEITSRGINQAFPDNREAGPNRLGAVYAAANFGTADVERWGRGCAFAPQQGGAAHERQAF